MDLSIFFIEFLRKKDKKKQRKKSFLFIIKFFNPPMIPGLVVNKHQEWDQKWEGCKLNIRCDVWIKGIIAFRKWYNKLWDFRGSVLRI